MENGTPAEEDDPSRRFEFCGINTDKINENPIYLTKICLSDESIFFVLSHS